MNAIRTLLQITLPIFVLAVSSLIAYAIISSKELPEAKPRVESAPVVEVYTASRKSVHLSVSAQGTVTPRTETRLISEVSGRIEELSPGLASGGFFEEGELLLDIDDTDYIAAVEDARAAVARAEATLAREEADAEVARQDWETVGQGREASALALRVPQLKEARANLASAEARFEMAKRDVERTKIRAPYPGRVRARMVDVGQFVTRGTALADIFAVDFAEVRLPVPDDLLPRLDLVLDEEFKTAGKGPEVILSTHFAGKVHRWTGYVERVEGTIDTRTRSIILVVRVSDPYGRRAEGAGPPLLAGLYVQASVEGRFLEDAVVIPRASVRTGNTIFVLDARDQLDIRQIELLSTETEDVVVLSGLQEGERVVSSPLELPVEGMQLRVEDEAQ
jgi:RND family efflux transporter MFP subunit